MRVCCKWIWSSWLSSSRCDSVLNLLWWASPSDGPTSSESMSSEGICLRRCFSLDFDMSCRTNDRNLYELASNYFFFKRTLTVKRIFKNLVLMGFRTTYECGLDVDFMRFVAVQTTNTCQWDWVGYAKNKLIVACLNKAPFCISKVNLRCTLHLTSFNVN